MTRNITSLEHANFDWLEDAPRRLEALQRQYIAAEFNGESIEAQRCADEIQRLRAACATLLEIVAQARVSPRRRRQAAAVAQALNWRIIGIPIRIRYRPLPILGVADCMRLYHMRTNEFTELRDRLLHP